MFDVVYYNNKVITRNLQIIVTDCDPEDYE